MLVTRDCAASVIALGPAILAVLVLDQLAGAVHGLDAFLSSTLDGPWGIAAALQLLRDLHRYRNYLPTARRKEAAAAGKGTTITLGDSEFGSMLFDSKKQAIYIFENDPKGESACYDDCAEAWPPVFTDGSYTSGVVGLWLVNSRELTRQDIELPSPVRRTVAWLEARGWGQRVLLPGEPGYDDA